MAVGTILPIYRDEFVCNKTSSSNIHWQLHRKHVTTTDCNHLRERGSNFNDDWNWNWNKVKNQKYQCPIHRLVLFVIRCDSQHYLLYIYAYPLLLISCYQQLVIEHPILFGIFLLAFGFCRTNRTIIT